MTMKAEKNVERSFVDGGQKESPMILCFVYPTYIYIYIIYLFLLFFVCVSACILRMDRRAEKLKDGRPNEQTNNRRTEKKKRWTEARGDAAFRKELVKGWREKERQRGGLGLG